MYPRLCDSCARIDLNAAKICILHAANFAETTKMKNRRKIYEEISLKIPNKNPSENVRRLKMKRENCVVLDCNAAVCPVTSSPYAGMSCGKTKWWALKLEPGSPNFPHPNPGSVSRSHIITRTFAIANKKKKMQYSCYSFYSPSNWCQWSNEIMLVPVFRFRWPFQGRSYLTRCQKLLIKNRSKSFE